jgi:hypothetical protein
VFLTLPDRFHHNNTYKALRIVSKAYNLYYSVWCNNEHELYDLHVCIGAHCLLTSLKAGQNDPGQLKNLLAGGSTPKTLLGLPVHKVVARLDSLLFVLKSCKGNTCIRPWKALHPHGDVSDLHDALRSEYDTFYEKEQKRVKYNRCEAGYIIDAEGPQFEKDGLTYRYNTRWSDWV